MADIIIDRIQKSFAAFHALKEISLTVADGEFVSLLGPSGCGKTTLLRIIAGLETASAGDVRIGGKSVIGLAPKDRGLAMVFQNYAVFPHMTVYENVAFGLRMQKADDSRVKAQVAKAAGLLHIEQYLDRYPNKLSGGQRQRVAVARALAVEPKVLLMDEPLSNLDALLRLEMRTELKTVLQSAGTTTVYVTHDQTEAMGLSDRIAVMHEGVIEQVGTPTEIYNHPSTRFVGGFIGSPPMNFIKLPVVAGEVEAGAQRLAVPAGATGEIVVGVRGESVERVPAADGLEMHVRVAEPMGSHLLLTGSVSDQLVRVVLPASETVKGGDRIGLKLDRNRLTWLSPDSGKAYPPNA